MVLKLKITNILKLSVWGLEKSELPWEQNIFIAVGVSCSSISLPSFRGLNCKLANSRLLNFILIDVILG